VRSGNEGHPTTASRPQARGPGQGPGTKARGVTDSGPDIGATRGGWHGDGLPRGSEERTAAPAAPSVRMSAGHTHSKGPNQLLKWRL